MSNFPLAAWKIEDKVRGGGFGHAAYSGLKTSKIDAFSPLYEAESALYGILAAFLVTLYQGTK